jgi:hypothetical protein
MMYRTLLLMSDKNEQLNFGSYLIRHLKVPFFVELFTYSKNKAARGIPELLCGIE